MKLTSITVTSSRRAIIGPAIKSVVDWVDEVLIIDLGITDDTLDIVREIAGDKMVVRAHEPTLDLSRDRNFGLDVATELGADWCMILDTDERIHLNGEDIRGILENAENGAFSAMDVDGSYSKERFFRLPMEERYFGPAHETILAYKVGSKVLPKLQFSELPKTAEQVMLKFGGVVRQLRPYCEEHPEDPRWHYYLGDSLHGLRLYEEAIEAYGKCAALRGWDEESAWACYRAAECCCSMSYWDKAVQWCADGLTRHAGLGELTWLASYASFHGGKPAQALYWAYMSEAMGRVKGHGAEVPRTGFRHNFGLYEGPYDMIRYALQVQGDIDRAQVAAAACSEAMSIRLQDEHRPSRQET